MPQKPSFESLISKDCENLGTKVQKAQNTQDQIFRNIEGKIGDFFNWILCVHHPKKYLLWMFGLYSVLLVSEALCLTLTFLSDLGTFDDVSKLRFSFHIRC